MKNHYPLMVRMNDASVRNILAAQCLDPASPIYGICEHHGLGYISAEQGLGETAALVMAYYTPIPPIIKMICCWNAAFSP